MGKEGLLARLIRRKREIPKAGLSREERIFSLLHEHEVPFVTAEDFLGSRENALSAFSLLQLHFSRESIRDREEGEFITVDVPKEFSIIVGSSGLRGQYTMIGIGQLQETALGYLYKREAFHPGLVERMGGDLKAAEYILSEFIEQYGMPVENITLALTLEEKVDELTSVQEAFHTACDNLQSHISPSSG